ncbi:MAG: Clp protease N-terminal domain-containing protein, partial [Desulfobulbaceae bacterium]|nr:Clp protease N-terminal domain-containing protein [Desulfobulbaceae bacterium]
MQLDKFTLKSQEALQSAQLLAETNGQQEMLGQHLLLAILNQPAGVVVPVLKKMEIDQGAVT